MENNISEEVILRKLGSAGKYQDAVEKSAAAIQIFKAEGLSVKVKKYLNALDKHNQSDVKKVVENWMKVESAGGFFNKVKKASRSFEKGVTDTFYKIHQITAKGDLKNNKALLKEYSELEAKFVTKNIVLPRSYKNDVIEAMNKTINEKDKLIGQKDDKIVNLERQVYRLNDELLEAKQENKNLKIELSKSKEIDKSEDKFQQKGM